MLGKAYWKDVRQSFLQSKGRVLSIVSLMALGSFAFIGLKAAGANIRLTGEEFFKKHQTADVFVMSNYGLDTVEKDLLAKEKSRADIEYGYFHDVTLKNTSQSFRIFSKPKKLSTYDVVAGTLPKSSDEIALSAAYQNRYKLGQDITFTEKKTSLGQSILKRNRYKIVGFVNSSEILSRINLGPTQAGSGELSAYAVVNEDNFKLTSHTIARLAYHDVRKLSPYSDAYLNQVYTLKEDLWQKLDTKSKERLAGLEKQVEESGQEKLNEAHEKLQAKWQELQTAKAELEKKENELSMASLYSTPVQLAEAQRLLRMERAKWVQAQNQHQWQRIRLEEESKKQQEAQPLADFDKVSYRVYTRRELMGADGYVSYENNAVVIDGVGNIFPMVLYFIASLVTFTTMTRFVDEERSKSGTLVALGYTTRDIMRKFILYGLVTGLVGTAIGIAVGHTLMPWTVYRTYAKDIILSPMIYRFYPVATLLAVVLSLVSSVLPVILVAKRELSTNPAQLLLPKPPAAGSKIFLERLGFIWSRMSFTQKVTARNIFRYKRRMFMTVFGVAGSVALLFAGLGTRDSIANLNRHQFQEIIRYDMLVSETNSTSSEKEDLQQFLNSSTISNSLPLHYETLTKVVGNRKDQQQISLLALDKGKAKQLSQFIRLKNRHNKTKLKLTDEGVILSEKLATLSKVKVGDHLTLKSETGKKVKVKVVGIAEMYMNHFIFMTDTYYQKIFQQKATTNAHLVTLSDRSSQSIEKSAVSLMSLSSVKAVIRNTNLREQTKKLITSLNSVMYIMLITSLMLALVILYNLTNVNMMERIRELSTIKVLGFYNREVTLYIYRETFYLSLIGIGLGFLLGQVLHRYMIGIIPPDTVMFNPDLNLSVYLMPTLLTLAILGFIWLFISNRLKKVDMLEALKSVD